MSNIYKLTSWAWALAPPQISMGGPPSFVLILAALMGSFEHSNRELLAMYICRNICVFVLLCVGFSLCYVQCLVCVMCSL